MAPTQKKSASVTRDGTICAKNSTYGYFDGINPFIGKWHALTVSYPDYGSWSIHVFRPKQGKKHTLWGGTYPYGLYKGVPSAGLYNSLTGTSTCVLINDFPCRRGKFDATSVLFIYFHFFLGSDMTIKLKLYFKILFRYEQNLSEESKMFINVPYRRDHLRIVPK